MSKLQELQNEIKVLKHEKEIRVLQTKLWQIKHREKVNGYNRKWRKNKQKRKEKKI